MNFMLCVFQATMSLMDSVTSVHHVFCLDSNLLNVMCPVSVLTTSA